MSTIFTSGWEGGSDVLDKGIWDSQNGSGWISVDTAQHLQGTQSLKCTGTAVNNVQKAISAISTCGIRVAFYISSVGGANCYMVTLFGAGSAECAVFTFDDSGHVSVRNGYSQLIVGSAFAFTANTWYQLEILFVNGTSIKWKVWDAAGKNLVQSEQSSTISIPAYNVVQIKVGEIVGVSSKTCWFDALTVSDSAYPGPYLSTPQYPFPSFNPSY